MPTGPAELPASLYAEYRDPSAAYPAPGTVLVAERAGRAIGCVTLKYKGSVTAEVKRLYVRPEYRGGIGRILMGHLHEHATRQGLRHLILEVLETRQHAITFYRTLGYTDIDSPATTAAPLIHMERHR